MAADVPIATAPRGTTCAACGSAFHCGVADATPCWCTQVDVDAAALAARITPDAGCLCPACLAGVARRTGDDPAA